MKIKILIFVFGLALGANAQSTMNVDAPYIISINVVGISLPGDGLIYNGRFEIDEDLVLSIPKIRNAPYFTSGTVMVRARERFIPLKFTGRSDNVGTEFNFNTILPWGREAMCSTQILNLVSIDGMGSIVIELTIRPGSVLSRNSNQFSQRQQSNLCEFDELTLEVGPNYAWYEWEYREAGEMVFRPFYNPQPENSSITFTIEDIFGPSYTEKLGSDHAVYFRMHIGSCAPELFGPYTFFRQSPEIVSDTVRNPMCHNDYGAFTVTEFNRDNDPDETFRVQAMDMSDSTNTHATDTIRSSSLPVTITGLIPGKYRVLVQSFKGQAQSTSCGVAQYAYFTIDSVTAVSTSSSSSPATCYGTSTGSITLTASGGSGSSYQYSSDNGNSYQPSNVFTGLSANTYQIQVKNEKGCVMPASREVVVSQPSDITIASVGVTSVDEHRGRDISCVGASDGEITLTASGGTGVLTYICNGITQTSNIFTGLGAGSYTITVKDGNNCTKATTPIPIATPPAITASLTAKSATCFGRNDGEITVVNPSGGTGALSFSVNNGTNYQTNQLFIDVPPGARNVIIQDENLCTSTFNTTIDAPSQISITPTSTIVTCSGGSDGEISVTASNIQSTAQYSLNGTAFQSTNVFTGLASNSYTVTVRESSDPTCLNTASVTLNANPVITGAITVPNVISCNTSSDGSLNLTPGGGVGPYTYAWNTGATTEDLSNLASGTYTVTITDSKNCTKEFNRVLTAPAPIGITYGLSDYTDFNIRCNGESTGSINLIPSGGNGGYGYTWNTGATSQNLTSLPAGTYTVTVRDSKNCTGTQAITLTQPPQLANTLTTQNVLCFGDNSGSITFATTGGTGADTYQYSINNGTNWSPTATFNNLITGTYAIQVRDENGCTLTDNRTLTSPPEIQLILSNITNTTCNQNNGSAQALSTGGAGTHSYTWLNSDNQTIATASSATNLQAGVYSIRVTDQNACTKQQTVTISSSNGPQVTTNTIIPTTCHDTNDGEATINITQGQAPYTILWPNGHNTATAENLTGGEYIVEVRDQTNCLALHTVTIPSTTAITITTTEKTDPNCAGNADGKITTIATGGNGTYSYIWNTGATIPALTNIPAGTYILEVKDIKNCTRQEQITLIDPPVFTVDLGPDQKICDGMTITKASTEDNATYQWTSTNGYTSDQQQVNLTEPGVYTLTVITQKGCTANDSFELTIDPDLLKADFLMVNEAHVGDTVVMIDISWPMPQSISWMFAPQATIIDQTTDYSMVRYEEPGAYATQLTATLAQCISTYEQWITILEAEDETENEQAKTGKDFIKTFIVYPNPTPGVLSVKVELQEQEPLTLEVYQAQSNQKVYGKMIEATTEHIQTVDLSKMAGGVYIVRIKAGNETKSVKLIKVY